LTRLHQYLRFMRRLFSNLPKRAWLTLRYHGVGETLRRLVTFPLRLTPLGPRLGLVSRLGDPSAPARAWYPANGRPVAVVIPSYGPAGLALKAARSVRRTTDPERVRVIVADDGSPAAEVETLRASRWIDEVVAGENRGFAANCNRGIRASRPDEDVVLLNSDVVAHRGWLEVLQHAAHVAGGEDVGVTGAKLLYPDDTIQFAGAIRNPDAPEWFDHRFRFRRADHATADVMQPVLAVTGACMYVTRDTLTAVGELDEGYGMAFEDVDYCLRVWESGRRVVYAPGATLTHHESKTRGLGMQGARELASQRLFWERWGDWFDARDVAAEDGGLRIVYVTQDVGVGGGHRVIFEHLEGLLDRGHHPELWTLAPEPPDWYDLRVPVRSFPDYSALTRELAPLDAIKVATWWETGPAVWEASVRRGLPVYFVQDVESSYYPDKDMHGRVYATYRPEFTFLTTSRWVYRSLLSHAPEAAIISPGVDTTRWRELDGAERAGDAILGLGRGNPLKNFPLTRAAYEALREPRPELWLFGIEPEVADGMGDRVTYHRKPSDAEVNELLNRATVFLQTSTHEGFCLPVLEAMAAGAPVVCTNAHGNLDFCVDGENCLMPKAEPRAVRDALQRVLGDPDLRERLRTGGRETARRYALPQKLDELDAFYRALAERRRSGEMPPPVKRLTKAEFAALAAAVR
jgi:GT2 family glycosyltransferase/glycosyltransferase involved in cell wall biosynthesis